MHRIFPSASGRLAAGHAQYNLNVLPVGKLVAGVLLYKAAVTLRQNDIHVGITVTFRWLHHAFVM